MIREVVLMLVPSSTADNSVQVFDTHSGLWSLPNATGSIPAPRFGHSVASIGSSLYVFGGAALHMPTIYTFGDLYRLDVSELALGKVRWDEFVSPQLWSFSGFGRPQRPSPVRQVPLSAAMTSNDAVEASRFVTTGVAPLERIESVLLPVGNNRLIVLGGRTVDAAQLPLTGQTAPWDESFAWSLTAIDCFNLKSRHWSRIHSEVDPSNTPYMRELVCSLPFPSTHLQPDRRTSEAWSIVLLGQRFLKEDFTEPFEETPAAQQLNKKVPTAPTTASPMPSPLREMTTFDDYQAFAHALPQTGSAEEGREQAPVASGSGSSPTAPMASPPMPRRTVVERVPSDERRKRRGSSPASENPTHLPSFVTLVQATAPSAFVTIYHRDPTASLLSVDFHLQSGLAFGGTRSSGSSSQFSGSGSLHSVGGGHPFGSFQQRDQEQQSGQAPPPSSTSFQQSPSPLGPPRLSIGSPASARSAGTSSGSLRSELSKDRGLTGQLPSRPFFRVLVISR